MFWAYWRPPFLFCLRANAVAPINFLTSLSDRKKSSTTVCFLSRRKHWRFNLDFFSQSLVTSHPTEGITHARLSKLVPWNLRWKSTAKGSCCGYLPPALTDFLYAKPVTAMAESSQRFATLTEKDVQQLLDEKEVKNTKRVTKMSQTAFNKYLKERRIS